MSSRHRVLSPSQRTHGWTSGGSRPARGQRTATTGRERPLTRSSSVRSQANELERTSNNRTEWATERSHFLFSRRANCTWNLNRESRPPAFDEMRGSFFGRCRTEMSPSPRWKRRLQRVITSRGNDSGPRPRFGGEKCTRSELSAQIRGVSNNRTPTVLYLCRSEGFVEPRDKVPGQLRIPWRTRDDF